MSDITAIIIILGLSFLLSKVIGPRKKGTHRDIIDAEVALNRWRSEHGGIHPADWPLGRLLAERYRDAILDRFRAAPDTSDDPEYRAKLAEADRLSAPRHRGSFHAIA